MDNLKEFYQNSERFRDYVDRCAADYNGKSIEEVLELAMVREVAKYYQKEDACRIPAGKSTYAPMGECV